MKYFARYMAVNDYPHNGKKTWCVLDSKGGAFAAADEANAIKEANARNQQEATSERTEQD